MNVLIIRGNGLMSCTQHELMTFVLFKPSAEAEEVLNEEEEEQEEASPPSSPTTPGTRRRPRGGWHQRGGHRGSHDRQRDAPPPRARAATWRTRGRGIPGSRGRTCWRRGAGSTLTWCLRLMQVFTTRSVLSGWVVFKVRFRAVRRKLSRKIWGAIDSIAKKWKRYESTILSPEMNHLVLTTSLD